MDNDFTKIDGGYGMASVRPWHKKGTRVPGLMTVNEALLFGGANWLVTKEPLMLATLDMTPVNEHYATVRNGPEVNECGDLIKTPLGVVGERYTVIQNHEAFAFFDNALDAKVACIETVGVLGKGEVVFAMAKLPKTFEPIKGDPVEAYILLTTSHDGSGSIMATFTPYRMVCSNMLNGMIRGSKNVVKIRHTKSAKARLDQAHKVLNASDKYWSNLADAYRQLAMQNMTRLDTIAFIENLFPGTKKLIVKNGVTKEQVVVSTRTANNRQSVLELYEGDAKGSHLAPGTKWQAYNAISEYLDHSRSVRTDSNRWESTMFGSQAQNMRQRALDLLLV